MKYQDNHIDTLFKEQLGNLQKSPPPMAWENIQKELPKPSRGRKGIVWLFSSAAAVALLATGIGIGFLISSQENMSSETGKQMFSFQSIENINLPILAEKSSKKSIIKSQENFHPKLSVSQKDIQFVAQTSKKQKTIPSISNPKEYSALTNSISRLANNSLRRNVSPDHRKMEADLDVWLGEDEDIWITFEDSPKVKNKSKWTLGGSFSPALAINSPISESANSDIPLATAQAETSGNSIQTGYTTGLAFGLGISDKLSVESGILFAQRNGSPDFQNNLNRKFYDAAEGFSAADVSVNDAQFTANFIEIPVGLKYNLVEGNVVSLYLKPGVSGNFLLNYVAEQEVGSGNRISHSVKNPTFTPAQLNAIVSGGIGFKLWKGMHFNVEPTYRIPVISNSYAFLGNSNGILGLNTGLQYQF